MKARSPQFRRLALLALASFPTIAAAGPWYAGISAGQSRTGNELVANRESTITLASGFQSDFDSTDTAWKAFAGYRITDFLALEAHYADLGTDRLHSTFSGGDPPAPAAITLERKIRGYGADLVAEWPFLQRFGALARVGAFRATLDAMAALDGNVVFTSGDPTERQRSTTFHQTVMHYGVGAEYRFGAAKALRLEWERYDNVGKAFCVGCSGTTGRADTDFVSLGFAFGF